MKLFYKLRSFWKEVELNMRVLRAAIASCFYCGDITPTGRLFATHIRADGKRTDLGLVCTKVVTDAGVAYLVDCLQGTVEPEVLRFHGCGTGNTAESAAQTALVTETGSRVSGTLTEGASANIFRTVATIAFTSTLAIVEHAVFSASTAGTMLDRSLFAAINVVNGDSIQFTYELTLPSGS